MLTQLNTLYVLTQGTWLSKEGECVCVKSDTGEKRLPIHMIGGGIVTFGNVMITPYLMGHCVANNIAITCLTQHGNFLARIDGFISGNVLLRRKQHKASETPELAASIAKNILLGKFANSRTVLRRFVRDHPETEGADAIADAADFHTVNISRLMHDNAPSLETLRGLEGDSAARYFAVFHHLLAPSGFLFEQRTRRPPRDPVNALLSFLYTLLAHDCASACRAAGLDPQIGFLHRDRSGRNSLALDLLEELRSLFADRFALALFNRKQLTQKDFTIQSTGAVQLTEDARKSVLAGWQDRKKTSIVHPYTKDATVLGLIPFIQARLLATHLRGDLTAYPPFIWK